MITNKPKTFQLNNETNDSVPIQSPISMQPQEPTRENLGNQNGIRLEYMQFGPIIGKLKVEDEIVNKFLELSNSKRHPDNDFRSNLAGHLDHEFDLGPEGQRYLIGYLKKYFCAYWHTYFTLYPYQHHVRSVGVGKVWTNYMKKGDYNPPHIHTGQYSFVLYLQVPEELEIERTTNKYNSGAPGSIIFTYGEEQHLIKTQHLFSPKTGDMFIFPATARHSVYPFRTTDKERISMSGNIMLGIDPNSDNSPQFHQGTGVPYPPDYFLTMNWEAISPNMVPGK